MGHEKSRSEERLFRYAGSDQFEAAEAASEAAGAASEAAAEAASTTAEAASTAAEATSEAAEAASTAASSFLPQAARAMAAISEASRSDFFMLVSSKGVSKNRWSWNCIQSPRPD